MRWEDQRRSGNVEDRRGMRVPGGDGRRRHRHDCRRAAHLVDHRREPADAVAGGRRARRRRQAPVQNRPDRSPDQRPAGGVRRGGPRRHRGHLGPGVPAGRRALPAAHARALHRRRRNRRAAPTPRRSGRSTARSIRRSTSTSASSASWTRSSVRPATSPRPTSSPTRWAITCRRCSASPSASCSCASVPARSRATGCRCMQELQADCFAGVWGHHASRKNLLEAGDVEEGLRAAAVDRRRHDPAPRPRPRVARSRGRTARRSSASSGCAAGSRRAPSTPATPSGRLAPLACVRRWLLAVAARDHQIFTRCSGGRNSASPGLTSKAA